MEAVDERRTPSYSRAEELRSDLAEAIALEQYATAAELRDELAEMNADAEIAVLSANEAFYSALRSHDHAAMERLWKVGPLSAACTRVYPGFPPLFGRESILEVWREVHSDAQMALSNAETSCLILRGGFSAVVTCVERSITGGPGDSTVSAMSIFEKDETDGSWRLILHQARPIDVMRQGNGSPMDLQEPGYEYFDEDVPGATG